jgi:lipase
VMADKPFADALGRLTRPTPLLTAPTGFLGTPPAFLPSELVTAWAERVPQLRPQLVPDVNHYTIVFDKQAAAAVVRAITTAAV